MPALIASNCTNCAICLDVCPTNSISAGLYHFVVDTDHCEECRICIPVCPVNAIELKTRANFPKEELPASEIAALAAAADAAKKASAAGKK